MRRVYNCGTLELGRGRAAMRILLVEDDKKTAAFIAKGLQRAGFAVEHLYAGYDRSAYGSLYPGELVFVARKAGGA